MIPEKYLKTISKSLVTEGKKLFQDGNFLKSKILKNLIILSLIDKGSIVYTQVQLRENSLNSKCSCGVYGGALCYHAVASLFFFYKKQDYQETINLQDVAPKKSIKHLVYEPNLLCFLNIFAEETPELNKDWSVKIDMYSKQRKYGIKLFLDLVTGHTVTNEISINAFSWQNQEIINFLNKNCLLSLPFIIPSHFVHSFLLILTEHPNFFIKKKVFQISSQRPKILLEVDNKENKNNFSVKSNWLVNDKKVLESYFTVPSGVWLKLDKYYYYPFFSNRSFILNLLDNNEFNFSEKEFYSFNKKIEALKGGICFDIKVQEIETPCIPVLQLNWTNSLLEAHLSFEYMNRFVSTDEDYLWVKQDYIKRLKEEEKKIKEQMTSFGFMYQDNNFYLLNNLQKIGFFINEIYGNLCRDWRIFTSQNFDEKLSLIKKISFSVDNLSIVSHLLKFDVNVMMDDVKIQNWRKILFDNRKENERYLNLGDGTVVYLDPTTANALKTIKTSKDDCEFSQYMTIPLRNVLLPYVEDKNQLEKLYFDVKDLKLKKAKNIPKKLLSLLRDYQIDGVSWLQAMYEKKFSCILADEMGLGKTIQALTFLATQGQYSKVLIVSPKSLTYNWQQECQRFTPQLKSIVLDSVREFKSKKKEIEEANLVIISYRLLHSETDFYAKEKFDFLILDEAQYIKNANSLTTKCCHRINTDFKILLTGTPIENSILDLWTLFDFILPGFLGKQAKFKKNFYKVEGKDNINKLSKIIAPFIFRRYKRDVLAQLPSKQEQIMVCELSGEQKELYNTYLYEIQKSYNLQENKMQIFAAILRLKQICCSPQLILPDENMESAKFELFKEVVNGLKDSTHRALVFSQFTSMLAIIRQWFDEQNIPYLYLDGATKNRQDLIEKFNKDETIPFFLISLKAGGLGLNLTGADTVVHYDLWWNPMVEDQATDRAHRIGQKRKVNIIKLIVKDTIEEKIMTIQERKRELFYNMLENPDKVSGLTSEDFDFLFS